MSKKYGKYTIEDFIADDDFIQWAKFPTEESDIFWQTYIKNEPTQALSVQKAKIAVQQLAIVAKQNVPQGEEPVIWNEIEDGLPKNNKTFFFALNWKQWSLAASIFLILSFGVWFMMNSVSSETPIYSELVSKSVQTLKEVINNEKSKITVKLPDGSLVILQPNSRLSYEDTFAGTTRDVFLAGEGFFYVKKNPNKPFMVYANGLVTKVLGTSFSVKAFETDKEVIVNVKTGKVSVYSQKAAQNQDPEISGMVLKPNEKVVFSKMNERLIRNLVEKPLLLLANDEIQQFSFKDTSVEEIFSALEKAYGVEIIYDKEVMDNCRLTTSLTNENLFEKLDIICAGIEANYKVVDAQVIISSNGCN
jgi:transmembrane sensor